MYNLQFQRQLFNRHERIHALKYQSVITPDGIIVHLSGPYSRRRHDAGIFRESNFRNILELYSFDPNGRPLVIYGDPAYGQFRHLLSPFRLPGIQPHQVAFNQAMSSVRESVEWGFGKMLQYFSFLDFKKNQKVFLQPVAKYYFVGCIFTNIHTCINGSTTSAFFEVPPSTVEQYLRP